MNVCKKKKKPFETFASRRVKSFEKTFYIFYQKSKGRSNMKRTICDKCARKSWCSVMDRARGMACRDFERRKKNVQISCKEKMR